MLACYAPKETLFEPGDRPGNRGVASLPALVPRLEAYADAGCGDSDAMKARWVTAAAVLLVFAGGVGVGLLLGDDDESVERVDASDVEALVWEGSPGAGQPPDCRAEQESGLGAWRCTVSPRSPSAPPKKLALEVSEAGAVTYARGGGELGCCIPVRSP